MPNAKVLSEKQAIVAALTEKLQNAAAGVLVDYKGITVSEDTALRAELRKNNVEYAVVKNTLLRFAVDNVGMNELDGLLNGTTALAVCHATGFFWNIKDIYFGICVFIVFKTFALGKQFFISFVKSA